MSLSCALLEAFGVEPGRVLSLAGGGGKTSLMYALAQAAGGRGWRVLTTTTTRIWPPGPDESPCLLLLDGLADRFGAIRKGLDEHAHVTVAEGRRPDGKLAGVPTAMVDELSAAALADLIVVEADGSAGHPLKAPRNDEPVFPRSSTDCVLIMGIDALGQPLQEEAVFRSSLASAITGLPPGSPVTVEAAVELLLGPRSLAAAAPGASRLIAFLNKVDSPADEPRAYALARALLARGEPRLTRVVVGSLRRLEAGFAVFEK
jgi:probable selenium-dependent hydroxylase accessory protein YqeC